MAIELLDPGEHDHGVEDVPQLLDGQLVRLHDVGGGHGGLAGGGGAVEHEALRARHTLLRGQRGVNLGEKEDK